MNKYIYSKKIKKNTVVIFISMILLLSSCSTSKEQQVKEIYSKNKDNIENNLKCNNSNIRKASLIELEENYKELFKQDSKMISKDVTVLQAKESLNEIFEKANTRSCSLNSVKKIIDKVLSPTKNSGLVHKLYFSKKEVLKNDEKGLKIYGVIADDKKDPLKETNSVFLVYSIEDNNIKIYYEEDIIRNAHFASLEKSSSGLFQEFTKNYSNNNSDLSSETADIYYMDIVNKTTPFINIPSVEVTEDGIVKSTSSKEEYYKVDDDFNKEKLDAILAREKKNANKLIESLLN